MKRRLVWTIGAGLVVAAWGVVQLTPDDEPMQAPFVTAVDEREVGVGRAFEATVTGARLGDRAVAGGWSAEGTWLVVDLEAQARFEKEGAVLGWVGLTIDGVTYRASERPTSMLGAGLAAGLPKEGSVAFELPADLADAVGTVQIALNGETRLDSVVEWTVDLSTLPHTGDVELLRTGWAS